ncbi:2-hydroxyacyl-CoA dehydratase subunit D [Thermodesulfobacteriota bacterium]
METMKEINRIVTHRHEVAKEWKTKTGGKVFGYLTIDLPEELIYAAGILPVRILGSHEPEVITDPYMWNEVHCVFERDCLAQGLQGRYSYLDGIVNASRDPHARQCYFSWGYHCPVSYSYELQVPAVLNGRHALSYLSGEVADFKHSLEEWTGAPISNDAIDHAIEVYNKSRGLIKRISEFRKGDIPQISGAEFMEIALAGLLMDKKEYNPLLEQLIDEIPKRVVNDAGGTRIMLAGGPNDHIDLIESMESMGAQIVVDDHCTCGRYYMTEVVPGDDRLEALAARIINKPRSSLRDLPERTRHKHLLDLAMEYRAQGVIFMFQEHSDAEQFDFPQCRDYLEEHNIPTLQLEISFTNPIEQFRTRIEAFLEMLQAREA